MSRPSTTGTVTIDARTDVYPQLEQASSPRRATLFAAEHLETLWNTLSTECSIRLLCGYSSSHFGDERTGKHLDRICQLHTDSGSHQTDLLASWLLADRLSKFHILTR